jgi:hypothetical protein
MSMRLQTAASSFVSWSSPESEEKSLSNLVTLFRKGCAPTEARRATVQRVESSPENCLAIIASVPPPSGPWCSALVLM